MEGGREVTNAMEEEGGVEEGVEGGRAVTDAIGNEKRHRKRQRKSRMKRERKKKDGGCNKISGNLFFSIRIFFVVHLKREIE